MAAMPGDDSTDDDTVPSGRAAVDPLIAYPIVSSGRTGEIARPGDHSPRWLVPAMFVGCALFAAGLLYASRDQRTGDAASGGTDVGRSLVEASSATTSPAGAGTTGEGAADGLPTVGSIRVEDETFAIASQCEVQTPFAPLDSGYQVSSYFFVGGAQGAGLIDRVFDGNEDTATFTGRDVEFVGIDEIGDSGAFAARFTSVDSARDFDVVVNPLPDASSRCGDRVVTNEPGQFSEPTTLIVMDVCIDQTESGVFVAGLTSQGSRFAVSQTAADQADIAYRAGTLGATALRNEASASMSVDGELVSVSGVVTDGAETLDISIDVGNQARDSAVRPCAVADRL